jgi:hypothetical protein
MRNAFKISVGKHQDKILLGNLRRRWEDNIKINLKAGVRMWTGFIEVKVGSSDKLL